MVGKVELRSNGPKMSSSGNGLSILEIVKRLKAPLSEEQAWAIFYESASSLITIREGNKRDVSGLFIEIKLNTVEILKDGTINFKQTIECSTDQEEEDLLYCLGKFIFECLDYGMESSMERQLDPELELLISDMTCVDEGTGHLEELEESLRYQNGFPVKRERGQVKEISSKTISLESVVNRCIQHLSDLYHVGHFRAVCRALVNEALELTAFLQQLYNGNVLLSQSWGQGIGATNWALLQSLQEAQWAQLWLQVMRELRQGVTLRHVKFEKLPAVSYELTPYEMILNDIRYKRYSLSPVSITAEVKKDAHDVILEFIRSRPPLSKSSERKMNPLPLNTPTPYDQLLREIQRGKKLRSTPWPTEKSVREVYLEEKLGLFPMEGESSPPKRKYLNPPSRLSVLIDHWDTMSTDQSIDLDSSDSSRPETPQFCLVEQELQDVTDSPRRKIQRSSTPKKLERSQSVGGENCIKNENFAIVLGGMPPKVTRPVFPPSLRSLEDIEITSKIAMTLEEVKHVRGTLAKLELESLDPEDRLYKDLSNGRLCFCCRGKKFSLFGSWSRVCEICQRKVCQNCHLEVDSRSSYVFQEEEDENRRDSGIGDMYWPFAYLNLDIVPLEPGKIHKMCVSCKRFINSHC